MRKKIFVDLDGVAANLQLSLGVVTGHIPNISYDVFSDNELMKKIALGAFQSFGGQQAWLKIKQNGYDFWSNIPKTICADRLIEICKFYGQVCFLTSPGNLLVNAQNAGIASHGKTIWVKNNYPEIPLIITRDKYMCAGKDSVLIDDLDRNIIKFASCGGQTFKWPNQYTAQLNNKDNVDKLFKSLNQALRD